MDEVITTVRIPILGGAILSTCLFINMTLCKKHRGQIITVKIEASSIDIIYAIAMHTPPENNTKIDNKTRIKPHYIRYSHAHTSRK